MKKPKIISIRSAVKPRNGIILYAKVQSQSRPDVQHTVTKDNRGTYRCSCEPGMFNPKTPCSHVNAVIDREK